ncbi:hypothetical protein [Sphingobacterium sp.]|uniref:hypothetical protein n=1 Tax=Sphingobacterium sp. TaxID=341027 RepID=UPI002897578A|nr:hypothetical protein [Sphingobacterium sp.]
MEIDKTIKKKVVEDWLNAFPLLSAYNQNKLYKIVGPCLIGIELIKSPFADNYSPYFVIYPLWKSDVKTNLKYPILLLELKNKNGFQFDIPYAKHSIFFEDVVYSVKKQIQFLFEKNISLEKLMSVLDIYSRKPPLSAAPTSYLQAIVQEAKFKIALFVGVSEAQDVLKQINNINWDENHFKACKVDLNEWLQNLQTALFNRTEFLKHIEANREDKKMAKLQSSELTI